MKNFFSPIKISCILEFFYISSYIIGHNKKKIIPEIPDKDTQSIYF